MEPARGPEADIQLIRTLVRAVAQATAEYIGDGRDEHVLSIAPGCRREVWKARQKIAAAADAEAEAEDDPDSPLSQLLALLHAHR
jgi:hypothetical protein